LIDVEIKTLDKNTRDKIRFITFIVPEFARAFKMGRQDAYLYLKKYGGIDYLFRHWWALHTDNKYWTLRSLYNVCYKNGGLR
jgi:hypothetical protein